MDHVFAVEPEADNYRLLRTNVKLNDLGHKVTLFEAGVGDVTETGTLRVSRTRGFLCSFQETACLPAQPGTQILGFAGLLEITGATHVKLDCEGCEVPVLVAPKQLSTAPDWSGVQQLVLEFHHSVGGASWEDYFELLAYLEQQFPRVDAPRMRSKRWAPVVWAER